MDAADGHARNPHGSAVLVDASCSRAAHGDHLVEVLHQCAHVGLLGHGRAEDLAALWLGG
jgi:hypothetical protein